MITASRYHDCSIGHRVSGHESKCQHLHGHNYRIHFEVAAEELDSIGRVIDFSVIKDLLCEWVEENWDHGFLIWHGDSMFEDLMTLDPHGVNPVPFNPTAENMAEYLLRTVGPKQLAGTGVRLIRVTIEETRKCKATAAL